MEVTTRGSGSRAQQVEREQQHDHPRGQYGRRLERGMLRQRRSIMQGIGHCFTQAPVCPFVIQCQCQFNANVQ